MKNTCIQVHHPGATGMSYSNILVAVFRHGGFYLDIIIDFTSSPKPKSPNIFINRKA